MTASSSPPLRWYGWGDRDTVPPPGLLRLLDEELGARDEVVAPPVPLDQVRLPESALSDHLRRRLAAAVGAANLGRASEDRLRHAAGRSYLDLLALRAGRLDEAPDAVVHAGSVQEIARVLKVCSEDGCAVVPFGGGTSVVGGVAPHHAGHHALVSLALDRLDAVVDVDEESLLATLQAGMRGPAVEAKLAKRGLTLGHFPQSFEYASVGGFAATRSAGQASSGYGRFDEMVRGLTLVAPRGELALRANPPNAAGPSVLQIALGSEGTLGVITDVTVRVRPRARLLHYAAWSFADMDSGVAALRELVLRHRVPDVTRLSDAEETRVSLAMAGDRAATRLARRYLAMRGHAGGCLAIFGWEGAGADIGTRKRLAVQVLRRHGAVALGTAPGRAWLHSRFHAPYLRDALLDRGLLVETLETASTWVRLPNVRDAVIAALHTALTRRGTPPVVGYHISHVYPEGASLYFTVLARQEDGRQVEQWREAKRAATDAIMRTAGALTHHHAVGLDHAAWMPGQVGTVGIDAIRALRSALDPAGIMNPGKLIPYPVSDSNR
jgi:alkyldihydroxyacetonephosphate synthase